MTLGDRFVRLSDFLKGPLGSLEGAREAVRQIPFVLSTCPARQLPGWWGLV